MRRIEIEELRCAMNHMKIGKANEPSEVAIKLFKTGWNKFFKSFTNIYKISCSRISYPRNGC